MRKSMKMVTTLMFISFIFPSFVGAMDNVDPDRGTRNNPPLIHIPVDTPPRYEQHDKIIIQPVGNNTDQGIEYSFHVNMEEDLNGIESVLDQLPSIDPVCGVDWNFSIDTGEFWWQIDDEKIWADDDESLDSISVHIMFGIKDSSEQWDYDSIWLTLDNLNRPPDLPDQINYIIEGFEELITGHVGYTIKFWVDNVSDPDGDPVKYRWDFGDGATSTGRVLWHSYVARGYVTIQIWVDDGKLSSDKTSIMLKIPITDNERPDQDNHESDPESTKSTSRELLMVTMIGGCFIAIFIFLAILGAYFISALLSRSKKDEIDRSSPFNKGYRNQ